MTGAGSAKTHEESRIQDTQKGICLLAGCLFFCKGRGCSKVSKGLGKGCRRILSGSCTDSSVDENLGNGMCCIISWTDEWPGVVGQVPMARGWSGRLYVFAKAFDVQRLSRGLGKGWEGSKLTKQGVGGDLQAT